MSELRLCGGVYGGRRLRVPRGVRPTEGRVREALLSIWHEELPEARLIDLFAGSGALGLEALGRGAAAVVLVEGDPRVLRTLRENVEALGAASSARLYRLRLPAGLAVLRQQEAPFGLVFADPPYGFAATEALLRGALQLVAAGGQLALEHAARDTPPAAPDGWTLQPTRCYGDSCLSLYVEVATAADAPADAEGPAPTS